MYGFNLEKLIQDALRDLADAVKVMMKETRPATPIPRFRKFEIAPGIVWPKETKIHVYPEEADVEGYTISLESHLYLAKEIIERTGGKPRQILRSLRRIEAATAWCYARAEGRKRMAEEILRQQEKARETLEAEAAIRALRRR